MYKNNFIYCFILSLCICLSSAPAAETRSRKIEKAFDRYRNFIVDFQDSPDKAIPDELLRECRGIIIMRQYKVGFGLGIKGGEGIILLHNKDDNTWSPPAFIKAAEGSFGLQIGGQAIDAIFLIMNKSGVDMLIKTKFKIGVDASAAAGPVGRDVSAKVGPGTALLSYSRAEGAYAGVSFEGGVVLADDKKNRKLYGKSVSLRDILLNSKVDVPKEAIDLVNTLKEYSLGE